MAYNIGLNVTEVDGSASPAIAGAAVSVGAFTIITRRGVPNRPARISSFAKFVELFGGHFAGGLGAYLVKGFFDNGGQNAYVCRVVSTDPTTGAAPATLKLQDGAGRDTLTLSAGFRGALDPGSWGDDLHVKITPSVSASSRLRETAPAQIQGQTLTEPVDLSSLPTLSITIDGEPTPTAIPLQAGDFPAGADKATLAQIRDAINRRTTKLVASISQDKKLTLTSTGSAARLQKTWTSLQVSGAVAALGLASMPSATFGTPAARSATGTALSSVQGLSVGDAIRVSDGTTTATAKLLTVNQQTGEISWTPQIANIASLDPLRTQISGLTFDLQIYLGGKGDEHLVESHAGLTMEPDTASYAPRRLNDPVSGSRYVSAKDEKSSSGSGANLPAGNAVAAPARFNPGRDGTPTANDFIGDPAARTGFYAFDPFDVQLLCTERTDPGIVAAALAYCAGRGDCMFVGSVPEGTVEAGQALAYGQAFQGKKVYGALYGPWIVIPDPIGLGEAPVRKVPPTGHVMGVYARIESTRGVWKAPAGDEANLLGVLDVEYRLSDAEHTDLVKSGSINGVRAVPRAGIVIDASRTLSTDTRWLYVGVRLLFNYVKSSLKQGLRWARQEPNRDALWSAIKYGTVSPFLMGLWRQGAFGTGKPEQVFTVVCDATNNPPDEVEKGNLKIEVTFYPSRPAETIVIIVGQQPSGAKASEG